MDCVQKKHYDKNSLTWAQCFTEPQRKESTIKKTEYALPTSLFNEINIFIPTIDSVEMINQIVKDLMS